MYHRVVCALKSDGDFSRLAKVRMEDDGLMVGLGTPAKYYSGMISTGGDAACLRA